MSPSAPAPDFDKASLVHSVEDPKQRYVFYYGEGFRHERLPVGSRVVYPPPPLPGFEDVDGAIEEALENPLDRPPFSAQLRPGMKVTIAFDDISLPLPPMKKPDIRQRIIEKVLDKLAAHGIDDIHLIAALGLHRRMTPGELRRAVGKRAFEQFHPDRLYNHDAEDPGNVVSLGVTSVGEEVEVNRRVAESDLLVYVNINLVSMDGGHKSISTGLVTYKTIKSHHNVHTLMRSASYMDPEHSALHDSCARMGSVVEEAINVFKVETTLNSNTFPSALRHLQVREWDWSPLDSAVFHANRVSTALMPFEARRRIFQSMRAPYGVTGIHAGATSPVHERTLENVFRQQMVPLQGQADVMIAGVPYLSPYNVNSTLNPILVHVLTLGYLFNLYRGKPVVRQGGVMILMHPLENRFNAAHHPSYIDFFNEVLPDTRDAGEMEKKFEENYAANPRYIEQYRNGYAYHGVHPFYMWYWACYGQAHLGKVIVVGAKDRRVAATLGYEIAPNLQAALDMAQDVVGQSPQITTHHWPPIFMCDVS